MTTNKQINGKDKGSFRIPQEVRVNIERLPTRRLEIPLVYGTGYYVFPFIGYGKNAISEVCLN
jgi:hypothetical protein